MLAALAVAGAGGLGIATTAAATPADRTPTTTPTADVAGAIATHEAIPGGLRSEHLLSRVALIGASVTAGFSTSIDVEIDGTTQRMPVNLGHVVAQTLSTPIAPALSSGTMFFFMDPRGNGSRFSTLARQKDPSLLLAIDFLFWFGYGTMPGNDESKRLALLEEGLALLAPFTCPVVIGDFPDMSDAVGRMIAESQMPRPESLRALNERVRAWAADRPNVILFPLAKLVETLRSGDALAIGGNTWPAGAPLLQGDRLHPTVEGMVALTQQLVDELVTRDDGAAAALFERDAGVIRTRLKEDARARLEARRSASAGSRS